MDLNKIIAIVREEMMTANAPGGSGGFSGSAEPEKPPLPPGGLAAIISSLTIAMILFRSIFLTYLIKLL